MFKKNELLSPNQSGYKQYHSCETALLEVVNNIQQLIQNDDLTAVLMLDFSAAFDTVDHNCLLYKLKNNFGIAGNALQWLSSYLNNRSSSVAINGCYSTNKIYTFGVPQGSVLGPLLFILYTNELSDVCKEFNLKMHSYVDDTILYLGFNSLSEFNTVLGTLQKCLRKIETWMSQNFLKLNLDKTQALVCGKKRLLKLYQVDIENINIDLQIDCSLMTSAKLLGVYFEQTLSLEHMVIETCKVCFFKLLKLSNLRVVLSQKHKIMLINYFIISRLDYCNCLYACIPHYLLRKLEKGLNACIRFIYDIPLTNHDLINYYADSHILPIEYRIKYKLCLTVHKILNNLAPQYLSNLFCTYTPLRENLRLGDDCFIIVTEHQIEKIISHKMCITWNLLPLALRSCRQLHIFKKNLKTFYFQTILHNTEM